MATTETPSTPVRRPVAVASDPSMNEALRRIRREQAIAHSLQAAALADEAGDPAYAAGFRADVDRMRAAVAS